MPTPLAEEQGRHIGPKGPGCGKTARPGPCGGRSGNRRSSRKSRHGLEATRKADLSAVFLLAAEPVNAFHDEQTLATPCNACPHERIIPFLGSSSVLVEPAMPEARLEDN